MEVSGRSIELLPRLLVLRDMELGNMSKGKEFQPLITQDQYMGSQGKFYAKRAPYQVPGRHFSFRYE